MKKHALLFGLLSASILNCTQVNAGPYANNGVFIEASDSWYSAVNQHDVKMVGGYGFTNGAGVMLTNAYNIGKGDNIHQGYNELEGWYPLPSTTGFLSFMPGALINANNLGSGLAGYINMNMTFSPTFNVSTRYRYNHRNSRTINTVDEYNYNDSHQFIVYFNLQASEKLALVVEPNYFIHLNQFRAANNSKYHWEVNAAARYRIDENWMPFVELGWLDRHTLNQQEQVKIKLGVRYFF